MEDCVTEKYHPSRVIQNFVFLSRKRGCIRCISLQVYNKNPDQAVPCLGANASGFIVFASMIKSSLKHTWIYIVCSRQVFKFILQID